MPASDSQALILISCTKVLDWLEVMKLVAPVIVGLVSAYVATILALNKFKKEKHWDEKRIAYSKVITAIEELQYWAERVRAQHCCEPFNSVEANKDEALRELQRYSKTGALIFSKPFHDALNEANSLIAQIIFAVDEESLGDRNDERALEELGFQEAIEIRKILDDCLPKLVILAKYELPKSA